MVLPHARLSEKIAALTGYFDANHGYSLEFFAPIGHEPVDWFLRQKADAHCEYFATAGVMVLRAAGIPARYVTGFVVPEKSRYGDYWVVRNKYAHAWIQVWDDETGNWRTVDTTPAGGIPRASRPGRVAQLWNYLRDRYHVFRVRLHQRGLIWGLQLLLGNWLVRVLLGLGLTFGLLRLRRRTTAAVSATTRLPDETARQLQRLLHRMDRRLQRRHGLVRNRAETLHQFANRVAAAMPDSTLPDWYRQYAQARYAPGGDALLAQIRESAPRV